MNLKFGKNKIFWVIFTGAAVLALAGIIILVFSKANSGASPVATPIGATANSGFSGVETGLRQAREFRIEASNFKFSPAEIKVKKGELVRITVVNIGDTHDFQLDEFAVSSRILQAGELEIIEFSADTSGGFEFYCSIINHRALGMKGKLIVE